ncbi:hypothetical protein KUV50_07440, partial [Membranicola marinus]
MSDTNTHTSRKRQRETQCLTPEPPHKCQTLSIPARPNCKCLTRTRTRAENASGKRSVWNLDRTWCQTLAGQASGKRSVWNLIYRTSARHYPCSHAPTANVLHEHAHEPETLAGNAVSGTWTASGVRHLQGKLAGSAVSGTWTTAEVPDTIHSRTPQLQMSDTNTHTSRKRQREAQCLEPDIPLKCQTLSMLTRP